MAQKSDNRSKVNPKDIAEKVMICIESYKHNSTKGVGGILTDSITVTAAQTHS